MTDGSGVRYPHLELNKKLPTPNLKCRKFCNTIFNEFFNKYFYKMLASVDVILPQKSLVKIWKKSVQGFCENESYIKNNSFSEETQVNINYILL